MVFRKNKQDQENKLKIYIKNKKKIKRCIITNNASFYHLSLWKHKSVCFIRFTFEDQDKVLSNIHVYWTLN